MQMRVKMTMVVVVAAIAAHMMVIGDELGYYRNWFWDGDPGKQINPASIINPASMKKEVDEWRPKSKLSSAETVNVLQTLTAKLGQPAIIRERNIMEHDVRVWRFEGDEWLSVGVFSEGSWVTNHWEFENTIDHWEWRKPELSAYTKEEMKVRAYPIVKIDKEGLPPTAFFEFFEPYRWAGDETDNNYVTEFNATKFSQCPRYISEWEEDARRYIKCPRCTAEWDAKELKYDIWTKYPDERRGEYQFKGGRDGRHTNECHVGSVQFYKLASGLFMCHSILNIHGNAGANSATYLFEVYDRDIWSADSDKPIKSKMVRYLGMVPIDSLSEFRDRWLRN